MQKGKKDMNKKEPKITALEFARILYTLSPETFTSIKVKISPTDTTKAGNVLLNNFLYIAQMFYLAWKGKKLFADKIYMYPMGGYVKKVWDLQLNFEKYSGDMEKIELEYFELGAYMFFILWTSGKTLKDVCDLATFFNQWSINEAEMLFSHSKKVLNVESDIDSVKDIFKDDIKDLKDYYNGENDKIDMWMNNWIWQTEE